MTKTIDSAFAQQGSSMLGLLRPSGGILRKVGPGEPVVLIRAPRLGA